MRLVVTTWNLQGSAGVDVEAVAAHLRERGSDLLLLQEVQRRQARRLADALAARSLSWAFKHWPVQVPAEGMAVVGLTLPVRARATAVTRRFRWWSWRRRIAQLARIPLDPPPADPPPAAAPASAPDQASVPAPGRARPRRGAAARSRLTVVNVHLSPHSARATRAHELRAVGRLLGPGGPAIVAGDLNDLPDSPLAARLRGVGLRDAWSVTHPEPEVPGEGGTAEAAVPEVPGGGGVARAAGPGGSPRPGRSLGGATNWSGVGRAGPPNQRIDHVWLSAGIEVVAAHVPTYGDAGFERYPPLSDHLPLTVTLDV